MYSKEQIKSKLKDIFIEATSYDPFKEDECYQTPIDFRFGLDFLDIMEISLRIEKEFRIHLSSDEDDRISFMNIDELVEFISSKCSK